MPSLLDPLNIGGGLLGDLATDKPRSGGLLGDSFDDPRTMAVFAAARGLLSARRPMEGITSGAENYGATMQAAKQQAATDALRRLQIMQASQGVQQGQLQLTQLQQQVARQNAIRDALAKAETGGQMAAPGAMSAPAQAQSLAFTPEYNAQRSQLAPTPAQAAPAQGGNLTDALTQRLVKQAGIYAQGGDFETANKLYEQAAKFMPEVKEIGVSMQNGQPVNVITYKSGRQEVSPFAPTPKVHWVDQGGKMQAVNEFNQQPLGNPFAKTVTPGEAATNGLGWARLRQDDKHFQEGQNAPQYMQMDAGLVALPKKPGMGQQPTATIVTGPNGESLGKPLKDIPASVNTAIINNAQSLYALDKALALADGKNVGKASGDAAATGWKGYVPNFLLNRIDPAGVDTRAEISDIGSLKIHDRSGAAVTVSESPRLMPFIPLATDDQVTVKKKLGRLRDELAREQQALSDTYSKDQGYKPSPVKLGGLPGLDADAGLPPEIAAIMKKHGGK